MEFLNGLKSFFGLNTATVTSSQKTQTVNQTQTTATTQSNKTDEVVLQNSNTDAAAEKYAQQTATTNGSGTSFFDKLKTGFKNAVTVAKNIFTSITTKIKDGFCRLFGIETQSSTQQTTQVQEVSPSAEKINMIANQANQSIANMNLPEEMQEEVVGLFGELTTVESVEDAQEVTEKLYNTITDGINNGIYSKDNLGTDFEKAQMSCLHIATINQIDKLDAQKDTLIASINYPEEVKEQLLPLFDELADVTSSELAEQKITQIDTLMIELEKQGYSTEQMEQANKEIQNVCLSLAFARTAELDFQKISSAESTSTLTSYKTRMAEAAARFENESLSLETKSVLEKSLGLTDENKQVLSGYLDALWNTPTAESREQVKKQVEEYCRQNNLVNNMSVKTLFVTLGLPAPEDVKDTSCNCPPTCSCKTNNTAGTEQETTIVATDKKAEELDASTEETETKTDVKADTKKIEFSEKMLETTLGLFSMATDGEAEDMSMFGGDFQKLLEYAEQRGEELLENYYKDK